MNERELIQTIQRAATEGWETLPLGNQAITSIPEEIGQLKKLRELHLIGNKLVEVPSAIAELTELRVLSLARNLLETLPPQIGELSHLQKLYLDRNRLTSLPETIGKLDKLEELFLIENRLGSLPGSFGEMRSLRWVTLDNNEFADFPLQLCQLPCLEVLSLSGNKLRALPIEVRFMHTLKELNVEKNPVTRLPSQLGELQELQRLKIDTSGLEYPPRDVTKQGPRAILDSLRAPERKILISYSHNDKLWLQKLQMMLKPLVRKEMISVWDDTKIRAGTKWKEEIKRALAAAKVAVLIVSPDFLGSDFIAENELPPLLEAAKKEGLVILWVYVSSCLYDETEIGDYQAAHDISKPLDSLPPAEQGAVLTHVCKQIKAAAKPSPEGAPGAAARQF